DSIESLEERDYFQFSDLCLKAFWYFSAARYQVRQGMISEEEWHEVGAVLHFYLRGPGVRAWWAKVRGVMFGPEFTAFIDDQVRGVTSKP
ncbi:MAG: hypothetical protein R3223_06375, partial [Longimicrobiales bacterium]|nr:hypothetical protein [Longimicrobiales bacterium]